MLSYPQIEALACTGKLRFMCCLTFEEFERLHSYTEGMGPATRRALYDRSCCDSPGPQPGPTPTPGQCPPNVIDELCSMFDQEWLEMAAAVGAAGAYQIEVPWIALIAGIVSGAATAINALCFDKTVNDVAKTNLCTVITYADKLTAAAADTALLRDVVNRLTNPRALTLLANCCRSAGP